MNLSIVSERAWVMRVLLTSAIAAVVVACSSIGSNAHRELRVASLAPQGSHVSSAAHVNNTPVALTDEQNKGIARVLNATERFRLFGASQTAGYTTQYPAGCAQSRDGTQGFHYMNKDLVDGKVELLRPELVMYEPQRDGSLQLIGVDYVVPFAAWPSATPPTLLGVPFMRNEPLGVWALHIWAWRKNPSGVFAMWNPNTSCKHAK